MRWTSSHSNPVVQVFIGALSFLILGCGSPDAQPPRTWHDEVIYHVMPRSFADSNGDRHGDLKGFVEKLDYLQELGITAILFTPLYESGFYHNYFPTDYENIDPEYGTMEDYLNFIKEVHRRGMKFLMDMETQYAQSGHPWFDDSYLNPESPYSDYIYYDDPENRYPQQIFFPANTEPFAFNAWPDTSHYIATLDLAHPKVKSWMSDFYAYWVDPNGDGEFDDGVDGFRLDHIMDDLDNKGILTNLYEDLWQPILARCRSINPDVFFVGEQADWREYGDEMINASTADAAFGMPLRFAIAGLEVTPDMFSHDVYADSVLNASLIHHVVLETQARFSEGMYTITFFENHDMNRWASLVEGHQGKMRAAATLNLLLPGIPSIYYGQELGVTGRVGDWGGDVNHIPVRQAFPWTPDPDFPGTAAFYKDTGVWWDQSYYPSGEVEAFALSVQRDDPASLWHHYRTLIALRNEHAVLRYGKYEAIESGTPGLMVFARATEKDKVIVALNLTDSTIDIQPNEWGDGINLLEGAGNSQPSYSLAPYAFALFGAEPE